MGFTGVELNFPKTGFSLLTKGCVRLINPVPWLKGPSIKPTMHFFKQKNIKENESGQKISARSIY